MSSSRDNPLTRFSAFTWGIGTFLLFAVGLAVIYYSKSEKSSDLEDTAAAARYETKEKTFAAEEAALSYKEVEPGKKVQVPPRDVFDLVGKKLASTKPVAIEKPEQVVPGSPTQLKLASRPAADTTAIDKAPASDAPIDPAVLEAGKAQYILCAACHGQQGQGSPAGPVHAGSEWVNGPPSNLIRIQLRGLTGPITVKGQPFTAIPMMMANANLDDNQIAAVLTYVRNNFGNKASAITPDQVKALRSEVGKPPLTEADLVKP